MLRRTRKILSRRRTQRKTIRKSYTGHGTQILPFESRMEDIGHFFAGLCDCRDLFGRKNFVRILRASQLQKRRFQSTIQTHSSPPSFIFSLLERSCFPGRSRSARIDSTHDSIGTRSALDVFRIFDAFCSQYFPSLLFQDTGSIFWIHSFRRCRCKTGDASKPIQVLEGTNRKSNHRKQHSFRNQTIHFGSNAAQLQTECSRSAQ